jgi:hypothetical protein
MKLVKSLSLGIALALGTSGVLIAPSAFAAKKEKAPAAPALQVSKEFRAAFAPIEADIKAAKFDGMSARLDAAAAQFTAPDERFIIAGRRYDMAKATNNAGELRKSVSGMIDSKSSLAGNLVQLNTAAGQLAFNAKDYADAKARLTEAVRLGSKDAETYIILAETEFVANRPNEGLAFANQAVAAKRASGTKVPEEWYGRALSVAFKAKLAPQVANWSRMKLVDYPTAENWRTALVLYRDNSKLEGGQTLDLYRLMRMTKSLAGERDFYEFASLASERGLPGEAKSVLDEGLATGTIGKTSRPINELLAVVSPKVASDQASLAASERQAGSAANGKLALGTADAYLGYGQDAKAAALYELALKKGQVDVDVANLRHGIALARQGMTAEAKKAFESVGGSRADIAKFWITWLDLKR